MPGMHGMDALKVIHTEHPTLPVILFTAQPDVNSAVEALRQGATDYLLKPIKPEAIIERARSILAKQQHEKRKREILSQIELLQTELKELDNGEATNKPISSVTFEKERFLKRGNLVLDLHTQRVL